MRWSRSCRRTRRPVPAWVAAWAVAWAAWATWTCKTAPAASSNEKPRLGGAFPFQRDNSLVARGAPHPRVHAIPRCTTGGARFLPRHVVAAEALVVGGQVVLHFVEGPTVVLHPALVAGPIGG